MADGVWGWRRVRFGDAWLVSLEAMGFQRLGICILVRIVIYFAARGVLVGSSIAGATVYWSRIAVWLFI